MRRSSRTLRVHNVCFEAIMDIKMKTEKKLGRNIEIVDASFLLGKKYWKKNFGKITDGELEKIFKLKYG